MAVLKKTRQKKSVCIITGPLQSETGSYPTIISNMLMILSPTVDKIFLITHNFSNNPVFSPKVTLLDIDDCFDQGENIILTSLRHVIIELKISFLLMKNKNQIDGPVFILSGTLLLPVITAKLLKKTSILTAIASQSTNARMIYRDLPISKKKFFYLSTRILEQLTFALADFISVESPHVANFLALKFKTNKIIGNGPLFILDKKFVQSCNLADRPHFIGYIGRLSQEKGIENLIQALALFLKENREIMVIIGGDGPLRSDINKFIQEQGLSDRVSLTGWIPHDNLPELLNQFRLLILPSYTEGLPNIILEAMACGTPVLATPVGGVPDIITDEATGFIMENNSTECIVENIKRALNNSNREKIAQDAKKMVENKFTFERTVDQWKKNLDDIRG
jgi:glycosyltransferase involved in cell wall biosynthesis